MQLYSQQQLYRRCIFPIFQWTLGFMRAQNYSYTFSPFTPTSQLLGLFGADLLSITAQYCEHCSSEGCWSKLCNSLQFCNSAVHCAVRSWRTVENEASRELQCCSRAAVLQCCRAAVCCCAAEPHSCSAAELRKRRLDRSPLWESRMQVNTVAV